MLHEGISMSPQGSQEEIEEVQEELNKTDEKVGVVNRTWYRLINSFFFRAILRLVFGDLKSYTAVFLCV